MLYSHCLSSRKWPSLIKIVHTILDLLSMLELRRNRGGDIFPPPSKSSRCISAPDQYSRYSRDKQQRCKHKIQGRFQLVAMRQCPSLSPLLQVALDSSAYG